MSDIITITTPCPDHPDPLKPYPKTCRGPITRYFARCKPCENCGGLGLFRDARGYEDADCPTCKGLGVVVDDEMFVPQYEVQPIGLARPKGTVRYVPLDDAEPISVIDIIEMAMWPDDRPFVCLAVPGVPRNLFDGKNWHHIDADLSGVPAIIEVVAS